MSAHDVAWACNAGAVIETGHGDLLASEADALVNAVNTEGVMGAGIAAQFRQAWPSMFAAHWTACRQGDVRIGQLHVWPIGGFDPRYIVNPPTKAHFRDLVFPPRWHGGTARSRGRKGKHVAVRERERLARHSEYVLIQRRSGSSARSPCA